MKTHELLNYIKQDLEFISNFEIAQEIDKYKSQTDPYKQKEYINNILNKIRHVIKRYEKFE